MMGELFNSDFLNPLFFFANLKPKYFIPNLELDSLNDLDFNSLDSRGVKGIILDVDNTLGPCRCKRVDSELEPKFWKIKTKYMTCIITNTGDERRRELENCFGIHVIKCNVRKPRREPFFEAIDYMELMPQQIAVIGDRILTDVVGANRLGMVSVKVKPRDVKSEPEVVRAARIFEDLLLKFYR